MFLSNRLKTLSLLLETAAIILILGAEAVCGSISVNAPGQVVVKGEKVTLGDIAKIQGDDQDKIQSLRRIIIADAPAPGKTLTLRRGDIMSFIKADSRFDREVSWNLPEKISVLSDQVLVSKDKVFEWVKEAVLAKINWPRSKVKIHNLSQGHDVLLPRGDITYEINFPRSGLDKRIVPIVVVFKIDGDISRRVWINTRIDLLHSVAVAVKPMAKGAIVGPDDVRMEMRPMRNSQHPMITSLDSVVGKRAKRAILFNQPLSADMLEAPPLVKPGTIVRLVAEKDLFRVSTIGLVKGKAGVGEAVKVINLASKKVVYGYVIDEKTVKVEF